MGTALGHFSAHLKHREETSGHAHKPLQYRNYAYSVLNFKLQKVSKGILRLNDWNAIRAAIGAKTGCLPPVFATRVFRKITTTLAMKLRGRIAFEQRFKIVSTSFILELAGWYYLGISFSNPVATSVK
jgi:hypothetical protein